MSQSGLFVEDLSVSLPGPTSNVAALTNVTFEVSPGEVVGLVGESGAGKSMIAHAIAGQLPKDAEVTGSIRIDSNEMLGVRAVVAKERHRLNAALCFQNPRVSLSPTRSVGKQIADRVMAYEKLDNREVTETTLELLRQVGIRDPQRRFTAFPHELSGGMCQRVMIALAMACQSPVLLADEPSTGLDVTLTGEILRLFRDMADRTQQAILVISHDIAAISAICNRLMVLYAGSLVEIGLTQDLLRAPTHPYTRALIDAVPNPERAMGRVIPLPGLMPQLSAPPVSCSFAPRCRFSDQQCQSDIPRMTSKGEKWKVRCFHSELLRSINTRDESFNRSDRINGKRGSVDSEHEEPLVRLKQVDVGYRSRSGGSKKPVLHEINLTFNRGETVGIVGESGCGKSTLARTIMGLIHPIRGEVWFDQINLRTQRRSDLRRLRRRMQLVFQDALDSLNPRLPVAEIVSDPLRLLELTREEKNVTVDQVFEQVSLDPSFKPRLPQELSGGQAQRVGIARGLAIDPELIVFDEPTSALDATIQAQVLELIHSLIERRDRTYLFVSHDLATVRGLCDRIIVMYLGRVVEDGPVDRVFTVPQHPYTRALLGAIPRLHGELMANKVELKRDLHDTIDGLGCSLSPRCPFSEPRCLETQILVEVTEGHSAACWKVTNKTRNSVLVKSTTSDT